MRRLNSDEIDDVLIRQGIGVLAMVDNEQPYAIPMSFGYDSDQAVFPMQWGGGYDSRKNTAIDSNANVCLTVYEQDPEEEAIWRSIVITGKLYEIPEDQEQQAYASLAANAQFAPDLGVWGIPFEDVELRLFGLDTKNCTGREFSTKYEGWDVDTPE
jgi:nitroimidazol reductase NimA-like FMN-containing flavoprotein (pyridoxamine 5'-phosphate oxidase superfamily)